jgi:enamine deaminase RidA (YjgF/YER057c/UK114 family)
MIEEKIRELGFILPQAPVPLAAYIPGNQVGLLIMTSGQLPMTDGYLKYKGKLGIDVTEEEGKKAAEICFMNCLSVVKLICGDLEKVERIIKLTVYVNSANDFINQPEVANGASELAVKIFGENGKHARAAVGVNVLPRNAAVEIELIVKLKEH